MKAKDYIPASWQVRFLKKIALIYFLFVSLFFMVSAGFTQESKKPDDKDQGSKIKTVSFQKEIEGQVSAINQQGIAVVYKKETEKNKEYEIYIPFDKDLKIIHKKTLGEISAGDTVNVQYEEIMEDTKQGQKGLSRAVKSITFLRSEVKKPELYDTETESEDDGSMPFKGLQ